MMVNCGHGNARCVQPQIRCQQGVDRGKDGDFVFGCNLCGAGGIRLDSRHQGDTDTCRLQLAIDAEVIAAKGAGTGNSYTQNGFAGYSRAPVSGPMLACCGAGIACSGTWLPTTLRQRL